jgi:hypothetical protein
VLRNPVATRNTSVKGGRRQKKDKENKEDKEENYQASYYISSV